MTFIFLSQVHSPGTETVDISMYVSPLSQLIMVIMMYFEQWAVSLERKMMGRLFISANLKCP